MQTIGLRVLRTLCCVCAVLLVSTSASAQDAPPPPDEHAAMDSIERPPIAIRGFADADFAKSNDPSEPQAFTVGQFVLHMSAQLGKKVTFFGETSFTARSNTYTLEVERVIVRYDVDDHLKLSVGRYHTPISYWNIAFHHGLWLQTTIRRPEMIQVGGNFQPVHFVGLLAEGSVGSPTLGLGYNAGVGNGRGGIISRAGDAGDVNGNRAALARIYARPAALYGLEFGGSVYHDRVTPDAGTPADELISSAYAVLTRETPEILAEFANVHHHADATGVDYDSRAFYVQGAYRIVPVLKPYYRFERMYGVPGEPVFGNVDLTMSTAGIRYELSDVAALKVEYRNTRRVTPTRHDGVYAQVAITF